MAKLSNVKVVDMVGGAVTKIAYKGEEYSLTDEEARVGDIKFYIRGWDSQLADSYYKIVEIDDYARVEDENGIFTGISTHTKVNISIYSAKKRTSSLAIRFVLLMRIEHSASTASAMY